MRATTIVILALAISASACGGTTPTSPSNPTPPVAEKATYAVTDADGGAAVAGATVLVNGQSFTTDGSGNVTIDKPAAGTHMKITAGGFLEKEFLSDNLRPNLLPNDTGEEFLHQMVYIWSYDVSNREVALARAQENTLFYLVPADQKDEWVLDILRRAAAGMSRPFPSNPITVATNAPEGAANVIRLVIDPSISTSAVAESATRNGWIVGGTVRTRRAFERDSFNNDSTVRVLQHELGHVLGLHHHAYAGIMNQARADDWSNAELKAVRLMYMRRPGNLWQDNETNVVR